MLAFIIRRIGQSGLVLLIVGLVAFSMFRFVGDPIDNMLGQERTAEDIERLRGQLGLDQPFVVQYYRFLENAAQGNFGVSYRQGRPVTEILLTTGFLTASSLKALVLPSITLGHYQLTLIMRLVRSEMLEVLRQDYIRFARARGLRDRAVNFRHALKNTMVPVITVIGLQLGAIIAFAIITETVFQWPGVGLLFINAIQFVDIPVMAAYLMLISVMFVGINLLVDILYFFIDPRLRADGGGRH